jgi:hypothetical protein
MFLCGANPRAVELGVKRNGQKSSRDTCVYAIEPSSDPRVSSHMPRGGCAVQMGCHAVAPVNLLHMCQLLNQLTVTETSTEEKPRLFYSSVSRHVGYTEYIHLRTCRQSLVLICAARH